jgi:hypothetical protein
MNQKNQELFESWAILLLSVLQHLAGHTRALSLFLGVLAIFSTQTQVFLPGLFLSLTPLTPAARRASLTGLSKCQVCIAFLISI